MRAIYTKALALTELFGAKNPFIYSKSSEKISFKAAVIWAFCAVVLLFFQAVSQTFYRQKSQISYAMLLGAFAFCAFAFIGQLFKQ